MTMPTMPATIRAGDTLTALWSLPDHPATAGWVARVTLINAAARYQAQAAASGSDHALAVAAATTAAWASGSYAWTIDATLAAERTTVAIGTTQILPNLAAAATYDTRSNYRKALDAAELALSTHGARAYLAGIEVEGRKQTFAGPGDFLAFVSRLRAEVAREEAADRLRQGLATGRHLHVRFTGR